MGAGTGGTLAGVSRTLKRRKPSVRVFLADPPGSALFHRVEHGVLYAPQQQERTARRNRCETPSWRASAGARSSGSSSTHHQVRHHHGGRRVRPPHRQLRGRSNRRRVSCERRGVVCDGAAAAAGRGALRRRLRRDELRRSAACCGGAAAGQHDRHCAVRRRAAVPALGVEGGAEAGGRELRTVWLEPSM
mmetsp:Transcript_21668/g.71712  ORF Transcript_21668/g.71712 Transcript_21668/m.71712 type:complete len:190 (+) Transcript_21668:746-1315(+)